MKNQKTYWDETKNNPAHYYGGNQGWEVHLRREFAYTCKGKDIERWVWEWPFRTGDGVSKEEKALCRKEVKFARFKDMIISKAVTNRTDYCDLHNRCKDISEDEFRKIAKINKGFSFKTYIETNYLTYSEAFASFWRG